MKRVPITFDEITLCVTTLYVELDFMYKTRRKESNSEINIKTI